MKCLFQSVVNINCIYTMEKTGKPGGLPSTGSHRVGHN